MLARGFLSTHVAYADTHLCKQLIINDLFAERVGFEPCGSSPINDLGAI